MCVCVCMFVCLCNSAVHATNLAAPQDLTVQDAAMFSCCHVFNFFSGFHCHLENLFLHVFFRFSLSQNSFSCAGGVAVSS